jgi:hypothetical protein
MERENMGTFLYLYISKSVTREEWEPVYKETLKLVKAFKLAEYRVVNVMGVDNVCFVPTEEREIKSNDGTSFVGWEACGDYETGETGDIFGLSRDMIKNGKIIPDAGGVFNAHHIYEEGNETPVYRLWGLNSVNAPYTTALVAIASLIEDRLGEKAFFKAVLDFVNVEDAVNLANKYLDTPISLPTVCNLERFIWRVSWRDIPDEDKFLEIRNYYIGKDSKYKYKDEFMKSVWYKIQERNGKIELYKAILDLRKNGFTTPEQLVHLGYSLNIAKTAVEIG